MSFSILILKNFFGILRKEINCIMTKQEFIIYFKDLLNRLKDKSIDIVQFFELLDMSKLELPVTNSIVIFQFNGIGDNILVSSFIRNVRLNNPDSIIVVICNATSKDLYRNCPYINKLIPIECKSKTIVGIIEDLFNTFVEQCWEYQFKLALSPQWGRPNFAGALGCFLIKAQRSIGYSINSWKAYYDDPPKFYNDALNYDFLLTDPLYVDNKVIHNIVRKRYILEYLNYKVDDMKLEAWLDEDDLSFVDDIINRYNKKRRRLVGLGVGGILGCKHYPPQLLVRALQQININNEYLFVIIGDKDDLYAANYIETILKDNVINLVGRTTLRQALAVVSTFNYYIGNDTSVAHMAAVFNIPSIILFMESKDKWNDIPGHLSSVQQFSPYNDKAIIIQPENVLDICQDAHIHGGCCYNVPHCITQITPEEIIDAFNALKR